MRRTRSESAPVVMLEETASVDVTCSLLIVPLGATEQHGPHLPLGVDTLIANAVASALAGRAGPNAALAPALAYGASGEHEGFTGTVSIGTEALRFLLVEFGRSACRWAQQVVFVSGHGGNIEALIAATSLLRSEGRDVAWLPCTGRVAARDSHAGFHETSLVAHLQPSVLQRDRIVRGTRSPLTEILPALRQSGMRSVAPNGVLGDPTGASAAAGEEIFLDICDHAWERLSSWSPDSRGALRG